jgi:hypothetical protein
MRILDESRRKIGIHLKPSSVNTKGMGNESNHYLFNNLLSTDFLC